CILQEHWLFARKPTTFQNFAHAYSDFRNFARTHNRFLKQFLNFQECYFREMGASFRKLLQVLQVFCKFLQGFALFIFSFYVFCFCFFLFFFFIIFFFFLFYFFINLFYFDTLKEQNPYFLALCKKTNPDFFGTLQLFWHFARTLTRLSQFLNLQEHELLFYKNEDLGLCLFFFISLLIFFVFLFVFFFYFFIFLFIFF